MPATALTGVGEVEGGGCVHVAATAEKGRKSLGQNLEK